MNDLTKIVAQALLGAGWRPGDTITYDILMAVAHAAHDACIAAAEGVATRYKPRGLSLVHVDRQAEVAQNGANSVVEAVKQLGEDQPEPQGGWRSMVTDEDLG